jgi:hypothetical protein
MKRNEERSMQWVHKFGVLPFTGLLLIINVSTPLKYPIVQRAGTHYDLYTNLNLCVRLDITCNMKHDFLLEWSQSRLQLLDRVGRGLTKSSFIFVQTQCCKANHIQISQAQSRISLNVQLIKMFHCWTSAFCVLYRPCDGPIPRPRGKVR